MLQQKRIKAVLFDLDDTLIDWSKRNVAAGNVSRYHVNKMRLFLLDQGHDVPEEDAFYALFRETAVDSWGEAKKTWAGVNFGQVVRQTLVKAKLNPEQIDLQDVLVAYDWRPVPGIEPYEDTLPVLRSLKRDGYKIGLITNSMQPMWMRDVELRAYGLMPFLDGRITSGDAGYMKPHPTIYHMALKQLGVKPEAAVFVGDRPQNDILGANKAGLISIWIDPPHLNYELEDVKPAFTINRLGQLLPIINQLDEGKRPFIPPNTSPSQTIQG